MKVGIITRLGKNYGAALQAYALKRTIELMGHEVSIINYRQIQSQKTYRVFRYKWGPRGTIGNLKALKYRVEIKESSRKFDEFKSKYFNMTIPFKSLEQLQNRPPCSDIYISGSDQVWNPTISFDPAYYLDFGQKNVIRASYAASIGVNEIPANLQDEYKRRLSVFDYISVREKTAKQALTYLGFDSEVTLDPTLLLGKEEWRHIAIPPQYSSSYILCYMVSMPKFAYKLVDNIKRMTGMPIINLVTSPYDKPLGDCQIWNAGPEEFVGYFQNASLVITSSFHGTAFSLIYQKPFVSMLYNPTSSRVSDLLSSLGIEDRIIHSAESIDEGLLSMDYTKVNRRLETLQLESKEILNGIIGMAEDRSYASQIVLG